MGLFSILGSIGNSLGIKGDNPEGLNAMQRMEMSSAAQGRLYQETETAKLMNDPEFLALDPAAQQRKLASITGQMPAAQAATQATNLRSLGANDQFINGDAPTQASMFAETLPTPENVQAAGNLMQIHKAGLLSPVVSAAALNQIGFNIKNANLQAAGYPPVITNQGQPAPQIIKSDLPPVDNLTAFRAAIMNQESGGGANKADSVQGAKGKYQIMPDTFKMYAKPGEDINNPADYENVASRLFEDEAAHTGGDPDRMAVMHFSGKGNVAPPGNPTPYKNDTADANGKHVSSYLADLHKMPYFPSALQPTAQATPQPTVSPVVSAPAAAIAAPQQTPSGASAISMPAALALLNPAGAEAVAKISPQIQAQLERAKKTGENQADYEKNYLALNTTLPSFLTDLKHYQDLTVDGGAKQYYMDHEGNPKKYDVNGQAIATVDPTGYGKLIEINRLKNQLATDKITSTIKEMGGRPNQFIEKVAGSSKLDVVGDPQTINHTRNQVLDEQRNAYIGSAVLAGVDGKVAAEKFDSMVEKAGIDKYAGLPKPEAVRGKLKDKGFSDSDIEQYISHKGYK